MIQYTQLTTRIALIPFILYGKRGGLFIAYARDLGKPGRPKVFPKFYANAGVIQSN